MDLTEGAHEGAFEGKEGASDGAYEGAAEEAVLAVIGRCCFPCCSSKKSYVGSGAAGLVLLRFASVDSRRIPLRILSTELVLIVKENVDGVRMAVVGLFSVDTSDGWYCRLIRRSLESQDVGWVETDRLDGIVVESVGIELMVKSDMFAVAISNAVFGL